MNVETTMYGEYLCLHCFIYRTEEDSHQIVFGRIVGDESSFHEFVENLRTKCLEIVEPSRRKASGTLYSGSLKCSENELNELIDIARGDVVNQDEHLKRLVRLCMEDTNRTIVAQSKGFVHLMQDLLEREDEMQTQMFAIALIKQLWLATDTTNSILRSERDHLVAYLDKIISANLHTRTVCGKMAESLMKMINP